MLVLMRKEDQTDERSIREWCKKTLSGKYKILRHYKKGFNYPVAWTITFSNKEDNVMSVMYWS